MRLNHPPTNYTQKDIGEAKMSEGNKTYDIARELLLA
jgi:chorismate mutase